jgi:hypothetical protein
LEQVDGRFYMFRGEAYPVHNGIELQICQGLPGGRFVTHVADQRMGASGDWSRSLATVQQIEFKAALDSQMGAGGTNDARTAYVEHLHPNILFARYCILIQSSLEVE